MASRILITRALRQNQNVAAAHRNLALAHLKQGQLDDAVRSYSRAIALARIEQPRLHLMQSMINMQSLMYGGANGEYNNPRHR
jgi:tetratricopeptide (TPR) repeat protein